MNNCYKEIESPISPNLWLGPKASKVFNQLSNIKLNEMLYNKLVIKKKVTRNCEISAIIGQYGLYAKEKIFKNQIIGYYLGTIWSKEEYLNLSDRYLQKYHNYAINFDSKWIIDANNINMQLRYINDGLHSKNDKGKTYYNVKFESMYFNTYPVVRCKAIKIIDKNEQLFVNYGKEYWQSRKKI